ncbi:hypothetical protein ACFLRH_02265 [Actinomycetota bacterium]
MGSFVLDAGALIAVERRDRATLALLKLAESRGFSLRTHAMVVGQVWRDASGRQANLARLLEGVDIRTVDGALGRAAGELCGKAATSDPIDAALALLAEPGDWVLTSDPDDIVHLVESADRRARVVAV